MAVKNLDIVQKDTKTYRLNFTENDVAVDITGWTVYFTVKENFSDTDVNAKISKSVVASGADAEAGIVRISLTSTDTNIDYGKYYYDLKVRQSVTSLETMLNGIFQVNKTVRQTAS
jgi:hypothetical protein